MDQRIALRLPKDLRMKVEVVARERRVSLSEAIRTLLAWGVASR